MEPDTDQIECWSQDVVAAARELQWRTGVASVCLLGFRLGVLLAILAADQCPTVSSLVLVAPILSGCLYLRELRASRLMASVAEAARAGSASKPPETQQPSLRPAGALEVIGFWLSEPTLERLARIDLRGSLHRRSRGCW
jgi:hypothetical protein